jgi:hypothetical protein
VSDRRHSARAGVHLADRKITAEIAAITAGANISRAPRIVVGFRWYETGAHGARAGVPYKQASLGLAGRRWAGSAPSSQGSSSATSRAIRSEGKPCSCLATHLEAEIAMMSGILRLTICRAMQITVLPDRRFHELKP